MSEANEYSSSHFLDGAYNYTNYFNTGFFYPIMDYSGFGFNSYIHEDVELFSLMARQAFCNCWEQREKGKSNKNQRKEAEDLARQAAMATVMVRDKPTSPFLDDRAVEREKQKIHEAARDDFDHSTDLESMIAGQTLEVGKYFHHAIQELDKTDFLNPHFQDKFGDYQKARLEYRQNCYDMRFGQDSFLSIVLKSLGKKPKSHDRSASVSNVLLRKAVYECLLTLSIDTVEYFIILEKGCLNQRTEACLLYEQHLIDSDLDYLDKHPMCNIMFKATSHPVRALAAALISLAGLFLTYEGIAAVEGRNHLPSAVSAYSSYRLESYTRKVEHLQQLMEAGNQEKAKELCDSLIPKLENKRSPGYKVLYDEVLRIDARLD